MNINQPLVDGVKLEYTGKAFEDFDKANPYMIFRGYDSGSFCDLWVEYKGKVICVCVADVEVAEKFEVA